MPSYKEVFPKAFYSDDGELRRLLLNIEEEEHDLDFIPSTNSLVSSHLATIHRNGDRGGRLHVDLQPRSCHYQHRSNETFAAVSTCDGNLVSASTSVSLSCMRIFLHSLLPIRYIITKSPILSHESAMIDLLFKNLRGMKRIGGESCPY